MSAVVTFTVAGQADLRQRLNADGLAALGLAGPLLAGAWTATAPTADVANLRFTVAGPWYAPLAGMLITEPNPRGLGLSRFDGTPWPSATGNAVVFQIHPQARLRLERLMRATLEAPGTGLADRSVRPVPALILITNPTTTFATPWRAQAGELVMPGGTVSLYDEHGLAVDPFSFAAAVAAILTATPAAGAPMPAAAPAPITPAAIAGLAPAGNWVHAVDLHGRPWQDPPGVAQGVSLYSGAAGARVLAQDIPDGLLHPWAAGNVFAAEADRNGVQSPLGTPGLIRFGWQTVSRMTAAPLAWPAAGPQTPVRDTLRIAVCDPVFHILGNRTGTARDGAFRADALTSAEQAPIIREGSPVALFADGRSGLGWIGQVILGLRGGNPAAAFTSGPMFAASPYFDDGMWAFPALPGAPGAWPALPPATPVPGNVANVLAQLAPLRSGGTANWIAGTNDVLVVLPAGLPAGVALRLYPIQVQMGITPDEQPLLRRADGDGIVTTGGAIDTLRLRDPFALGPGAVRPASQAHLRMDATVAWITTAGALPQVKMLGNLYWTVGDDVPAPAAAPTNILAAMFWRSTASNPMIGVPPRGPFTMATVFADPVKFITGVVRTLSTDANPREAPRLPTMSRNESLFALQLPPATGLDIYRSMLTGGWLARESDVHSYRLGNPGAAGAHEVHAPALVATSQLGFDLWVAAAHRARPVVPTADVAGVFASGPNAGLPTNWVLLQANATSAPPPPPAAPSSIAAAVLQTVPAFVETPELAVISDNDVPAAVAWVTTQLGSWVTTPNDPELHRQIGREIRTAKYGRRDAQWALRRAIAHARELIYIETALLAATAQPTGGPTDPAAAAELITEIATRLQSEPRLRVVILTPRETPFLSAYEPFSMFFYAERLKAAQVLALAGGTVDGLNSQRPRVVIAHPVGIPGRPLAIRTTTVIVDDVWCLTGASTLSRRGLTFDGATDVALVDWQIDRGASVAIRAHRKALMGMHLGVGPTPVGGGAPPDAVNSPQADWVRLHQPTSAHEAFADILLSGSRSKLLPLWPGPDPLLPGATIAHPAPVADPDGRGGATMVTAIASAIGGANVV